MLSPQIHPYASLPHTDDKESIRQMLENLVVIKLNGGLGTSMGCRYGKSLSKKAIIKY